MPTPSTSALSRFVIDMAIALDPSPEFEVLGPFEIPMLGRATQIAVDDKVARTKLAENVFGKRRGCYVFCLTSRGRSIPWYVGKAAKQTFAEEIFNTSNCVKYGKALAKSGRGKPELYFVASPNKQGRLNEKAIDKLETRLVEYCGSVNSDILNEKKSKIYQLRIVGVINTRQGRPSKAATAVSKMMGLS